jgi:hypothetical protein
MPFIISSNDAVTLHFASGGDRRAPGTTHLGSHGQIKLAQNCSQQDCSQKDCSQGQEGVPAPRPQAAAA